MFHSLFFRSFRAFSLAEVLIAIVIITILTIGSMAVYSSQLGKARDTERGNDLARIKLLIDQIIGEYGSPPSTAVAARKLKDTPCKTNKDLYKCFQYLKISTDDDIREMFLDPSQGIANNRSASVAVYGYRYNADQNSYKICVMPEDQSSKLLNAKLSGEDGSDASKNDNLYCLSYYPPGLTTKITTVELLSDPTL